MRELAGLIHKKGCEVAERDNIIASLRTRLEAAERAIRNEIDILVKQHDGSTHWDGCDKSHAMCAAIKRLRAALKESP